jgi:hypothetical protein
MKSDQSKTKNFEAYRVFLKFPTKQKALDKLDKLAQHFKRHKNGIISCISQAEKNPLIYKKLRAYGYSKAQIPPWFAKPEEEQTQLQPSKVTTSQEQKVKRPSWNIPVNGPPQPTYFMGSRVDDWDKIQRYQNNNQHREPTISERITQDAIHEYEKERLRNYQKKKEQRRKAKKEQFDREIDKELAGTYDPWSTLQILLKKPEWNRWYRNQTRQEQTRTFQSITEINYMRYLLRQNEINMQQWAQYNEALFWQGRFQGKW